MENTLSVEKDDGKIYLKFNETAFFNGDSAVLREDARQVLYRVCGILNNVADAVEEIRVQGHTAQGTADSPNDPRATEVVIFLQQNSLLHPSRLVSEGFGQWRPVNSNATSETRADNRRVEMIISGRNLQSEQLGESVQSYIDQSNS